MSDETNNPTTNSETTNITDQISNEEKPICIIKKATSNRGNMRKRKENDNMINNIEREEEKDSDDTDIIHVTKKSKTKLNSYSTNDNRPEKDDNTQITTIDKEDFSYEITGSNKALYSDKERSSVEVTRDDNEEKNKNETKLNNEDRTYRGLGSYDIKSNIKPSSASSNIKTGPARSQNFRVVHRVDYQPDICKDYKQTGTCSFGDACIFMHDRGDYKSSWQIDKEYDDQQKRKGDDSTPIKSNNQEDELPFACFICKNQYTDPVMTLCKHFFCESCILSQKGGKCPLCKKPTSGSFSYPQKILEKLKLKSKLHFENIQTQ